MQINGQGNIEFSYRDGLTNLFHLYQSDPIRVLFPDVSSEEIKQSLFDLGSVWLDGIQNQDDITIVVIKKLK